MKQLIEGIEQVHETSLDVLKNVGVIFHNDKAVEVFKKAGARTDGNKVFLDAELVEKALDSCPERISIKTRNEKNNAYLGTEKKYFAPITGAVNVTDIVGGRRRAEAQDYINLVKLSQYSDMLSIIGGPIVIPRDIPEEVYTAFVMASVLSLTDKVILGQAANGSSAKESIRMARMVFGDTKDCFMFGMTNVITPLVYDNDSIEAIFAYVNEGQPIAIACCGITGVTGPVTLGGMLAVNNAEVLAGLVLAQLTRPGTPVIYGNISVAGDMRTMGLAAGAAESALITKAASHMAKYYKIPCRAGGTLTNAMSTDIQAGYESMLSLLSAMMSDSHIVAQSAGLIETFMTASYEKFIVDEEIFNMAQRYVRGIEVSTETLGFDAIAEAGPRGSFVASMHTFEHYKKELIRPVISYRDSYPNWVKDGKERLEVANEMWRKRLTDYTTPGSIEDTKPVLNYFKEQYGDLPGSLKDALRHAL